MPSCHPRCCSPSPIKCCRRVFCFALLKRHSQISCVARCFSIQKKNTADHRTRLTLLDQGAETAESYQVEPTSAQSPGAPESDQDNDKDKSTYPTAGPTLASKSPQGSHKQASSNKERKSKGAAQACWVPNGVPQGNSGLGSRNRTGSEVVKFTSSRFHTVLSFTPLNPLIVRNA